MTVVVDEKGLTRWDGWHFGISTRAELGAAGGTIPPVAPSCGGRLRVIAPVHDPVAVRAILAQLPRSGTPEPPLEDLVRDYKIPPLAPHDAAADGRPRGFTPIVSSLRGALGGC